MISKEGERERQRRGKEESACVRFLVLVILSECAWVHEKRGVCDRVERTKRDWDGELNIALSVTRYLPRSDFPAISHSRHFIQRGVRAPMLRSELGDLAHHSSARRGTPGWVSAHRTGIPRTFKKPPFLNHQPSNPELVTSLVHDAARQGQSCTSETPSHFRAPNGHANRRSVCVTVVLYGCIFPGKRRSGNPKP